jgi:protocatechuate 3,4-dioxygenase beta subunit
MGRVSGTVVESKSGEAIRKALVLLRRDPHPPTGTLTDASGKFTFRDLEPGLYLVAVEKDGWVVARASRALKTAVTAGQAAPALTVKLLRTAVISGRVTDADGDPMSGVSIQVTPETSRKSGSPGSWGASTNDRGEYRAYNVAPGLYRICATYMAVPRQMDVQMQPAPLAAYPRVCFPGTPQGAVLPVESGADLQGIDFQMIAAHAVKVTGRVISQAGQKPAFAMVLLEAADGTRSSGSLSQTIVRDTDGKFELQGVLPGRYRLTVAGASLNGEARFGSSRTIDVGDTDLDDVEVVVGPPRKIEGKVVVPEGRKMPPLMIVLQSRDPGNYQGGGIAQVSPEGTFSFPEVGAGDYDVRLASTGPDDDLYVSAIRLGDSDALAEGVRSSVPGNLEIVLKANGGSLACSVTDENDDAVPGGRVVLTPDPPREGQLALMGQCSTEATGACEILGITPGDYHIYAFPAEVQVDPRDPNALKAFEKYGTAVKVAEGEHHDVQLKAAPIE